MFVSAEMPFQIPEAEANVDRVSITVSHFNPPSRQRRASASDSSPNVLLVHHKQGVSVIRIPLTIALFTLISFWRTFVLNQSFLEQICTQEEC